VIIPAEQRGESIDLAEGLFHGLFGLVFEDEGESWNETSHGEPVLETFTILLLKETASAPAGITAAEAMPSPSKRIIQKGPSVHPSCEVVPLFHFVPPREKIHSSNYHRFFRVANNIPLPLSPGRAQEFLRLPAHRRQVARMRRQPEPV